MAFENYIIKSCGLVGRVDSGSFSSMLGNASSLHVSRMVGS